MTAVAQFLGELPGALGGPEQGRLGIPPRGRLDQVAQRGEEGRVVLFDEMTTAAVGPNPLGCQVVLGPLGAASQLSAAGPDRGAGQAGGPGDEVHAAASQRLGLTGGPLPAQALGHQRVQQPEFHPHRFQSRGVAHTMRAVQTACRITSQRFKLFFDSSY